MPISKVSQQGMYAGAVLQVVQTQYSTATTTTSSAQTSTGCTASITPSSSTNKVLAILNMPTRHNSVGQNGAGQISRNSGAALSGLVQDYYAPSGTGISGNINIVWLDSPATTSSVTYTATFGVNGSGGTLAINSDFNNTNNGVTYLTLLEISA
jgi:hypothetical protein